MDTCSTLHITASLGDMSNSNEVNITFDHAMEMNEISKSDLSVEIHSDRSIDYDWSANYTTSDTIEVMLEINSVLQGNEELEITFLNYKVFRRPNGG